MARLALRLSLLLLAALPAAATAAKVRKGPRSTAFYTPPSPLPGGGHGGLIWARRLTGTAALKGGWPVISWGHGTTGIADACAPSRDRASIDFGFPDLGVAAGLSERAAALYPQTLTACLGALVGPSSFGALAPAELIRPEVDSSAVIDALNAQDPERLTIRTPVRIQQGTADGTVFKLFTDQLVADYRGRDVRVSYKTYEGVDHGGAVEDARSARDATSYIRSRVR